MRSAFDWVRKNLATIQAPALIGQGINQPMELEETARTIFCKFADIGATVYVQKSTGRIVGGLFNLKPGAFADNACLEPLVEGIRANDDSATVAAKLRAQPSSTLRPSPADGPQHYFALDSHVLVCYFDILDRLAAVALRVDEEL